HAQAQTALADMASKLGVGPADVPTATKRLTQHVRDLKKSLTSGGKPIAEPPPAAPTKADQAADARQTKAALRDAARLLNVAPFDAPGRVAAMLAEVEDLKRQL